MSSRSKGATGGYRFLSGLLHLVTYSFLSALCRPLYGEAFLPSISRSLLHRTRAPRRDACVNAPKAYPLVFVFCFAQAKLDKALGSRR